jgi:hypothetical protein
MPNSAWHLVVPVFAYACITATAHGAAVSTLAGTTHVGTEVEFDAPGKTLTIGGVTLPIEDVDVVTLTDGLAVPAAAPRGLWLTDGSWLPAVEIRAAADDAVIAVGPLGELTLSLSIIRAWGEQELPESANDQVVVASGRLEGRVLGITGGKVMMQSELDPEPLALALADVQAFRLAGPRAAIRGIYLSAQLADQRPAAALLPGEFMRLAAAPAVAVTVPSGLPLRVEGGRRVYLSALAPASVNESGAFGVVWPHTRDANLDGTALSLGGARYARGLVVHSQAKLTWQLDGAFERLRATIGISDLVGVEGDCAATISADGKSLWHSDSVKGRDKPFPIDLDLAGVQVLELSVEFGERYDIGDHFALADAYLVQAQARVGK